MLTLVHVCVYIYVRVQVRLLHDGKERGRMYACYALSSILTTKSGMTEIRAAGVIPALIAVLNTSKVTSYMYPTTFAAERDMKRHQCESVSP